MKIRLLDPGFAGYTGLFGVVEFIDGVSVEISAAEAERFGTILPVEVVGGEFEGQNPSTTQKMVDLAKKNTEELGLREQALTQGQAPAPVVPPEPQAPVQTESTGEETKVPTELSYDYTAEQLAELADKQGIAGLRAFTDAYGVNGKSIAGIIAAMLTLKAEKNPAPVVVNVEAPEGTEVETKVEGEEELTDEDLDLDEDEVVEE